MAFKQPRVPEYRESEGTGKYLRSLVLFLKDFCMDVWTANNQRAGEIGAVKAGYPVTSVCGKMGDVALDAGDVGALATGGTAADSSKLGGKAPEYYLQPRNLLDNSDFTNPVDQRRQTEITGDWNYGIDRWLVSTAYEQNPNGSILITDNGLSMGYWTDMMQLIPFEQLKSKTLSFAVCTENGVYAYTMTLPESVPPVGGGAVYFGDGIWNDIIVMETIKFDNNDSVMFRFRNAQTTHQLVYWAALYEGSYTAETLPPYVPKGYAAELAECQRYFWLCDNSYFSEGCGYAFTPTECRFMISTPQTMRISPSIIAGNNNTTSYGIKLVINGTVLTPTSVSVRRANNRLCLTLGGNFTTNAVGVMRIESQLSFSADL